MTASPETIKRVRGAMQDRARVYATTYLTLRDEFGPEKAEELCRKAVCAFARERVRREGPRTPEQWVDEHGTFAKEVFESTLSKEADKCEQIMTTCALMDEWQAMGLSPEMQDLMCDIAMELDRERAAGHNIRCDIVERIGKGDKFCRVVLWKK